MSCHFGANYVLSQIVRTFWLSGGISTIRKYTAECQYCKIRRAKSMGQIMGNLPKCRVNVPKHPFEHTGVDLFGPIAVQMGRSVVKRWGVLFICMASRACHIEVVPDLTTDAFLQCFWRFTSRRGLCCRYLYSDQGTNFKGCDSELKELLKSKQINGAGHRLLRFQKRSTEAELRLAYLERGLTFNGGSMFQKIRMLGGAGKER